MRKIFLATLVLAFSVCGISSIRAEDSGEPKAVIEKALNAMGGEEKISKYKAAMFKTKGKFSGLGQPVEFTADFTVQLPKQRKTITKFDISGMMRTMTQTVNGDKGWMHVRGKVQDMPPAMLTQQMDELYSTWVATLLPLKGPDFKLSPAQESKVNDRTALGVTVSHEGHADITLYFDKESGLLVKSVSRGKGMQDKEFQMEIYYNDYKDLDGVKQYSKLLVKRDGKAFVETEFTDFKLLEKLDDKVFEKPPDD